MKKSAPDSPFAEPAPPGPIAQGDAAASQGDWPLAVSSWEHALHGPDHGPAAARLRWFLDNAGAPVPRASFRKPILLFSIALALLGTALVFLAQSVTGAFATALAIAAWACYVATAIGAIVYAWLTGAASSQPTLDSTTLCLARERARSLAAVTDPNTPDVRR